MLPQSLLGHLRDFLTDRLAATPSIVDCLENKDDVSKPGKIDAVFVEAVRRPVVPFQISRHACLHLRDSGGALGTSQSCFLAHAVVR